MRKNIFTLVAGLFVSAQIFAVSVADVCGKFTGNLNIGGDNYANKSVYLLPGTVDNAVTFVLPDFTFGGKGKLGNIVLPNIPMDANGQLTLENSTLYIDSIDERATITVLNGIEDGGITYNSILSETNAQVLLSIAAESLVEPILVLFQGDVVGGNYALTNGGFEGEWTNDEPEGWHSFNSASGLYVNYIASPDQFHQATFGRPGSEGSYSAMLSSKMVLGSVKANGNCTNGRINAGSKTADDPAKNYNYSDPDSTGFNTAFNGRPDSIVFWAKYLPADRNAANEVNKARLHSVITTNARYQDPEAEDYSSIKIGEAEINYSATSDMGWQRIAVPFTYYDALSSEEPAYIMNTFTTNMTPGGGSSYSTGTITKVNVLDTLYLDDVMLRYNRKIASFVASTPDGDHNVEFTDNVASVPAQYSDSAYTVAAEGNGVSSQVFLAFDNTHKCAYAYVIADDYAQSKAYSLYRVEFTDSDTSGLNEVTEGIESIPAAMEQYEKVIINGQLLIRRDNNWYNVQGVQVR